MTTCDRCKQEIRNDEEVLVDFGTFHVGDRYCIMALGRKVVELEGELHRVAGEQSAAANGMTVP